MLEEVELPLPKAPPDRFFATYAIFVLLGCGLLFPYNAFITAVDYFSSLYPNYRVEFAFPAVYTSSLFLSMFVMVRHGRFLSFGMRIVGSFACFLVIMIAIPIFDFAMGEAYETSNTIMFGATLAMLLLTGIADAVAQGTLYGYAGQFPPLYVQAIQNGNGVAGLAVSLLRVFTKVSVPNERTSSLLYFALAGVVVFLCIVSYFILIRLPFTKYYLTSPVPLNQEIELSMLTENSSFMSETSGEGEVPSDPSEPPPNAEDLPHQVINVKMVIYKIGKVGMTVCLVFFVTLLGFPGLLTSIDTTRLPEDWYPIILITVFNLGDFFGKNSPAFFHTLDWNVPNREYGLRIASIARVLFIFLFVLCVHVEQLAHEAFVITLVLLFGFSGGFLGACLLMVAPSKVSPAEKEVAGTAVVFFLVMGLALGSTASFCIEQFVGW